MSILLLSDLHLPHGPSPLRETFARFLAGPAREASVIYILGDLFEYWIGDDVGLREYAPEIGELRILRHHGVHIRFMHGNRDFLAGHRFAAAAGVELIRDPLRIELDEVPTLLSHGDMFCTSDVAYQRWRRFSRNPVTQGVFRLLPEALRRRIGEGARNKSKIRGKQEPWRLVDVEESAIHAAFRRYDVTRIIHGHTHRPGEHSYTIDGRERQRIVLADWRLRTGRMEYLVCDAQGWRRVPVPPPT